MGEGTQERGNGRGKTGGKTGEGHGRNADTKLLKAQLQFCPHVNIILRAISIVRPHNHSVYIFIFL